jgi:cysteinyl-tRNA synthetase
LLLGAHYRSQIDFTWDGLEGARVGQRRLLERLRDRLPRGGRPLARQAAAGQLGSRGQIYLARLDAAVSNDLNTAQAVAVLTELSRDHRLAADEFAVLVSAAEDLLALGLLDLDPDELEARRAQVAPDSAEVERKLEDRAEARRRGDFATADRIRDSLERRGIDVRDTREGTVWNARAASRMRNER